MNILEFFFDLFTAIQDKKSHTHHKGKETEKLYERRKKICFEWSVL